MRSTRLLTRAQPRPRQRARAPLPVVALSVVAICATTGTSTAGAQSAGPAAGSVPVAATFTLADAEALVHARHPLLAAAGGRRLAVTGAARQEAAIVNPTVEWRRENLNSPLPRDEFLTAGLPLDGYGRRFALRRAQDAVAARATADSATTTRTVEYDVGRAYWRAALARALHDVVASQRAAVDTVARIEAERATQGAVAEGVALRARLEADRAHLNEAAARADAERARGELARVLDVPFDSVPWPTDPIDVETRREAVAPLVLARLLASAHERRPELVSARARVIEARRRQLAERIGSLPAVGLQAGSKRTAGYRTGVVGVGVSVPLFDRNSGGRERARGELVVAEADLRDLEARVDAEVTSGVRAYAALATVLQPSGSAGASSPGGRQSLDGRGREVAAITAAAYREGAATLLELLDAERVRADVRIAALRAATELHLAELDVAHALGAPIAGDPVLDLLK